MFKRCLTLSVFIFIACINKVFADYTVTTIQPLQPNYYYGYPNAQCNVPYYTGNQAYNPIYGSNQTGYYNPYQYNNTYNYNPYGNSAYGYNPMNALGLGAGTNVKDRIIRNVGQSVINSMIRGY